VNNPNALAGPNGSLVHKVRVKAPMRHRKTYLLTFTQHSPDRYTATGFDLADLVSSGVSIERRQQEKEVLSHGTSARYVLREADEWIAHSFVSNSYYGALAVGATAEEAYANLFPRVPKYSR
jgi:hypothetical protein